MIRHILFATDGSFSAERAGDYVASFAIRFHAKVTILHAIAQGTVPLREQSFPNSDTFSSQKAAKDLTEKTAERLRNLGAPEVDIEIVSGQPTNVILGVAESIKPDLIIVGGRGLSTWQGLLLGSVSTSVVQRAEVPVLVVK